MPGPHAGDETSIPGVINRESLTQRLALQKVDRGTEQEGPWTFAGRPVAGFRQRIFGGHLLAQTVLAACETPLVQDMLVNSTHTSFLSSGSSSAGVLRYAVTGVRKGKALSVVQVSVFQNDIELARTLVSSARPEALGVNACHAPAPPVPAPDELPPLHRRQSMGLPADGIKIPTRAEWVTASIPIDIRFIDDTDARCFWFRVPEEDSTDQNVHRAHLAFASDRSILQAISHVRGDHAEHTGLMRTSSIDHALWFHTDVQSGLWYLYVQDSPFQTERAGLARGLIHSLDGRHVASVVQQGLIRT